MNFIVFNITHLYLKLNYINILSMRKIRLLFIFRQMQDKCRKLYELFFKNDFFEF
jgi:hypothetical protein